MKKSNGSLEPLDLERDLPTTAQDVAALKGLRENAPKLSFEEYFRFLAQFGTPPLEVLRSRRGPRGEKPFELP